MLNHQDLQAVIEFIPELHTGSIKSKIDQSLRCLAAGLKKQVHLYEKDLDATVEFIDTLDEESDKYSVGILPIRIEDEPITLVFSYNKDRKTVKLDHEYDRTDPKDTMICLAHKEYKDQKEFEESANQVLSETGSSVRSSKISVPYLNSRRLTVDLQIPNSNQPDPKQVYFILNPFEESILQVENIQIDIPQPSVC